MKLSEIRALLKANGFKTTDAVDRVDVKRHHGEVVGADVSFADGRVAYLTVAP